MTPAVFGNLIAYALQITVLVVLCAGVQRLLRVRSAGALFVFWRAVTASCLVLPFIQPWKHATVAWTISVTGPAGANSGPADSAIPTAWLGVLWDPAVLRVIALVIALGIAAQFAWLAAGLLRLQRLRKRVVDEPFAGEFADLQNTIGTQADIRWTDAVPFPVTFGWRHPVVLLPSRVRRLESVAARAVVAHELFHVRRRDWLWQVAEDVLRGIFWFHPAMWWLIARLQLAREAVVDELSILATNARRAYMDALLSFADDPLLFHHASAFSRRRHLFHRIVLLSREGSMSSARLALAAVLLCGVLGGSAAVAVAAFPLIQPPRDPVPGQLSPEQRAVLQREVDHAREALAREPGAPDLHHRLAAAIWARAVRDAQWSDAERIASLREGVNEENAALRVRPDYLAALQMKSTLLEAVAARTTNPIERNRALAEANRAQEQASAAARAAGSDVDSGDAAELHALKVGKGIRPPEKIHNVNPEYPADAKAAGVQGVVVIECLIDATGHVARTKVLRSVPELESAAVDAVRQWEYKPVLLNGAPVPVVMVVTVSFRL